VASSFGFNRARGEREGKKQMEKNKNFSSPIACQGKKEKEQCPLKRHCFYFF